VSVRRGLSAVAGVVTLRPVRAGLVRGFVRVTHTFVRTERAAAMPAGRPAAGPRDTADV